MRSQSYTADSHCQIPLGKKWGGRGGRGGAGNIRPYILESFRISNEKCICGYLHQPKISLPRAGNLVVEEARNMVPPSISIELTALSEFQKPLFSSLSVHLKTLKKKIDDTSIRE
jgi:hypothetical protein